MPKKRNPLGEEPVPPFPSVPRKHDSRGRVLSEEFILPDDQKQAYLDKHYPFEGCPRLDDTKFDLHEEKVFTVRDYKLVREDGLNYIVSPYCYNSGGTVIDWMDASKLSGASAAGSHRPAEAC